MNLRVIPVTQLPSVQYDADAIREYINEGAQLGIVPFHHSLALS